MSTLLKYLQLADKTFPQPPNITDWSSQINVECQFFSPSQKGFTVSSYKNTFCKTWAVVSYCSRNATRLKCRFIYCKTRQIKATLWNWSHTPPLTWPCAVTGWSINSLKRGTEHSSPSTLTGLQTQPGLMSHSYTGVTLLCEQPSPAFERGECAHEKYQKCFSVLAGSIEVGIKSCDMTCDRPLTL